MKFIQNISHHIFKKHYLNIYNLCFANKGRTFYIKNNVCLSVHAPKCFSLHGVLTDTIKLKDINTNNSVVDNKITKLCTGYKSLTMQQKNDFLIDLALNYSSDYTAMQQAAKNLIEEKDGDRKFMRIKEKLRLALTPQFYWLFVHIGRQENGVKFLVDMRTDLLELLKDRSLSCGEVAHLQQLDSHLKELLKLWFSVGFLKLERITWKSSCDMLQKISDYEAVHPVRSWTDLKKRVGDDRRCFVYTHSSMPDEPLVVLHTALRPDIVSSLAGLTATARSDPSISSDDHDHIRPQIAAAIFYSISSSQPGLQGIELGNYIIKRVAAELVREFPKLNRFSTLSPVPKFKMWFFDKLKSAENDSGKKIFTEEEMEKLKSILETDNVFRELRKQLNSNAWLQVPGLADTMETILVRLCLHYLYYEKKRGYALCSVGPPGVRYEDAYMSLYPIDRTKCPQIDKRRDILYELYTRHNPTWSQPLMLGDEALLQRSYFNFSEPTVIYFHAFFESSTATSAITIRSAYIQRKQHNVIVLNAQRLEAGPWYVTAASNTRVVGEYSALFIDWLVTKGLRLDRLHLIGLSLGAQMAGVTGSRIRSGKVARITGLDPAKPLFTGLPISLRLDATDAEFVDVIHTDAGIFGYPTSIGHVDFYPNGGISPQPGCLVSEVKTRSPDSLVEPLFCSHWRSYQFFAESVVRQQSFISVRCKDWSSFVAGRCDLNSTVYMGYGVSTRARGNYYLTTNREAPFSRD